MFDLITIGDATLDLFVVIDQHTEGCSIDKNKKHLLLNYGEKIYIETTTQSMGGNAANVAVGAQTLGLKTAIATEVGADINGYAIMHALSEAGVHTSLVKALKGKETRYSVVLNYESERTILSYHTPRIYTLPKLPSTAYLYYTSLGKSFEGLQDTMKKHVERHPETRLVINPGSYQLRYGMKKIQELFSRTFLAFFNKEEAAIVIGEKEDIPKTIKKLHSFGIAHVAITDSERGSYASDGQTVWFLPPFPIAPLAKTGAGDAYASGFLSALFYKKSIPDAMRWGTANAGGVIQEFGAQKGLLNNQRMRRVLAQYKKIVPEQYTKKAAQLD